MDASNRHRPALPPIQFLDSEKLNREDLEYQSRHRAMSVKSVTSSTGASPRYHPIGPPPPYSNVPPAPPTTTPSSAPAIHHVESWGPAAEDQDSSKQHTRQSLPSLQEALGVEQPVSHASEPVAYTSSHSSQGAPATSSPLVSSRHTHAMAPPAAPSNPYMHTPSQAPYQSQPRTTATHHNAEPLERRHSSGREQPANYTRPSHAEVPAHSPVIGSGYRSAPHAYTHAEPASVYESAPSASAPAPPRSFGYGYAPAPYPPPQFAQAPPPPGLAPSIYQPSITQPHPSQHSSSWRSDGPTKGPAEAVRSDGRPYGESVKRHLDMYDFEAALNEVAENSTIALDFSRQYGARLHQTQRSGPLPGTLPAITEIDDLVNRSRNTLDALNKMREVLVAQQAVYYQQAQEQRFKTESENKRNDSVYQSEEAKGSINSGEAKKRRGRAAAPGRCHSCNRAETPEWRRGPDGARTLCNACGLHYAKLTRKAGANKAAVGSSNLRPKSPEQESSDA